MKNRKVNPKGVRTNGLPTLSPEQLKINHTISQRKYRQKQNSEGYRRLEICIDPELWEKLSPYIDQYKVNGELYPGQAIVKFLNDLSY
jgi:hypothetical protein